MKYNPYTKELKSVVFDIETSGLSPANDRIISASFIEPDGSNLVQFFLEHPAAEDVLVAQIINYLENYDAVITYNGNSFDIPFVNTRAKKYLSDVSLPKLWKIDIYRWLKNYWQLAPGMQSLRQVAVEEALGLSDNRTDEIDGGQCVQLYSQYINLGFEKAKDLILLHNADDVRQLARITQQLSFLPYDKIAFEQGFFTTFNTETLLGTIKNRISIDSIKLTGGSLGASATAYLPCTPAAFYEDAYELTASSDGEIKIKIPYIQQDGMKFFDIEKLRIKTDIFDGSPYFSQGYLIAETEEGINYEACNKLIKKLLEKLI